MGDLPQDWFIDNDGQRLILDPEKVAEEIDRLQNDIRILEQRMPPPDASGSYTP